MLIQSTSFETGNLVVYVQNVGHGTLQLRRGESTDVNSILRKITSRMPSMVADSVTFSPGTTVALATDYPFTTVNEKPKVKITAIDGTFTEYTSGGSISVTGTFPSEDSSEKTTIEFDKVKGIAVDNSFEIRETSGNYNIVSTERLTNTNSNDWAVASSSLPFHLIGILIVIIAIITVVVAIAVFRKNENRMPQHKPGKNQTL